MGVYENTSGRKGIVDTSTGWDFNEDDKLFGWIEYNIAETDRKDLRGERSNKKKEMYGKQGRHEAYVPGIVKSLESSENYFMPVIWPEEREDIRETVEDQTGVEKVRWRPNSKHYAGDKRVPLADLKKEVFDIALLENDIELEPDFDEETGVETWPETGAVQVDYSGGRRFYGYIKEHTRQTDMDKEPIEVEAELVARLDPYGELGELSGNEYFNAARRIAEIDSDIDSIDQVKSEGEYVSDMERF